jgi:hypothetical protein
MKLPEIRVVTLLPLNESSRSLRPCVVDLLAMDRTGGRGKSVGGGGMRWSGIEELSCFIAHRCLNSESYRIVEPSSMLKTCAF